MHFVGLGGSIWLERTRAHLSENLWSAASASWSSCANAWEHKDELITVTAEKFSHRRARGALFLVSSSHGWRKIQAPTRYQAVNDVWRWWYWWKSSIAFVSVGQPDLDFCLLIGDDPLEWIRLLCCSVLVWTFACRQKWIDLYLVTGQIVDILLVAAWMSAKVPENSPS